MLLLHRSARHPSMAGRGKRFVYSLLAIDLAAVTDAHDQDADFPVADLGDHTVVADAVFPELPELVAFQCGTEGAGILGRSDALAQELEDAA